LFYFKNFAKTKNLYDIIHISIIERNLSYENERKLTMLKSLCDKGVLTQEEFDEKAAQLERA